QKEAEDWEKRWCKAAFSLMDLPGRRLAAAEAALQRMIQFCEETFTARDAALKEQTQRLKEGRQQLAEAKHNCITGQGGGFNLFGGKARRLLRTFMDQLTAYSRQALAHDLLCAGTQFYGTLAGRLKDRMRDLSFCKQRLRHMQESLENPRGLDGATAPGRFETELTPLQTPLPSAETYWDAIRETETARLVLPDGETELEEAAQKFLRGLEPEQWAHLEQSLQEQVLSPLGGVHHVCVTYSDLARSLAAPVLNQLGTALSDYLPVTD